MRIFDTPELFDGGVGASTGYELKCEFCGITHNKGLEPEKKIGEGDSVLHTNFAGKQICDCCFEKIETEILRRIPDIIDWYMRILEMRENRLIKDKEQLKLLDITIERSGWGIK